MADKNKSTTQRCQISLLKNLDIR